MKYADIVFLQGQEAEGVLGLLEEEGEAAALNFLNQWNYGDSPIEEREDNPWGFADNIYKEGNLIMCYNTGLDYIGLIEVIKEGQK